jgi:hypothetical protein
LQNVAAATLFRDRPGENVVCIETVIVGLGEAVHFIVGLGEAVHFKIAYSII